MDKKFVIWTVVVTVLIMVGGVFATYNLGNSAQVEASKDAKAMVTITDHDWGEIDIRGGKVDATYDITNEGDAPLKLFNVVTSCACTSATLTLDNQTSPLFGMHSKSDYVMEVAPGETATVKAVFDPLFHGPNGVGSITREITVETNDLAHKVLTFTASANVVKN